jgi:hypothetical protein
MDDRMKEFESSRRIVAEVRAAAGPRAVRGLESEDAVLAANFGCRARAPGARESPRAASRAEGAADELESGEDEPEVVAPSSAAAMAGVAPNATPTPAVTAPIWSHRSTGNVAESRFERRIPLWLGMIELLGKDIG